MSQSDNRPSRRKFLAQMAKAGAVAAAAPTMVLTGCEALGPSFLEEPPTLDVTKEDIFSDPELAKRFLWRGYRSLPYGPDVETTVSVSDVNHTYIPFDGASAEYYDPVGPPYANNRTLYNYRQDPWDGIRQGWIFIENVGKVPNMSAATKARLKAEARMLIAFHYTELFRNFGGVPWVDHAIQANEVEDLPRMQARAMVETIVGLIDQSIPDLPFVLSNPATESGRFTAAGAMGLKCRLLLFAASPLFNDGAPYLQGAAADEQLVWFGGYDPQLWQQAADACEELIREVERTAAYHLVDTGNPRQDFQDAYYERESSEVLISLRTRYRRGGWGAVQDRGRGCTTHDYVQMFPMADGTPIDAPNSGWDPQNRYENRDPRLYETVLVNGDKYRNRTVELWIGGRERPEFNTEATRSGYRMRKFVLDGLSSAGTIVHYPYLRLPEIYLSYAEALNEVQGGPSSEAYRYVNKVRNRVDLEPLPSGKSQEEFREAVLRERALEFGYEEIRWYDIIRRKRDQDLRKTLHGLNIRRQSNGSFSYERFELPARLWQSQWSPKWYMGAIPRNVVLKNQNLIQNPGWA